LVCNNISFNDFDRYTDYLINLDMSNSIHVINSLYERGYSVLDIFDNYFTYIKYKSDISHDNKYKLIKLICKYISIFHTIHEHNIELVMFTKNAIDIFIFSLHLTCFNTVFKSSKLTAFNLRIVSRDCILSIIFCL